MSKVAQYLQAHLVGEVISTPEIRAYFATDASVFTLTPHVIVYPRAEADVRKLARFAWQLAERGRAIALTARGLGTDQGGAAISNGILIVFPAHFNKILSLDSGKGLVTVQPGLNYGRLQQALNTHGMFLPPYPQSLDYSTIGGAIANNASGEKSVKYGDTKNFVRSLRVVLANGEVITTGKLSKRDVNKKMGLATFEGEIYRSLDGLLNEHKDLLAKTRPDLPKNTAGYDIWGVRDPDGSIDLTKLFVGSQGTLGIVTEAKLEAVSYNPQKTLLVAFFDDVAKVAHAAVALRNIGASAVELIDDNLLMFIEKYQPNQTQNLIDEPLPKIILMVEFDDVAQRQQKKRAKRAQKVLYKHAYKIVNVTNQHDQEDYWKIRHNTAAVLQQTIGSKKAIPVIDDGVVPPERLNEFIDGIYKLFKVYGLEVALWGQAGDANMHVQPFFDLSQVSERQQLFKLMNEYYKLVVSLGGSTTGQHNDGRLRAPYLNMMYGDELYEIFRKVKQIFDPFNTLNPGVKIDVTLKDIQPLLRHEYSVQRITDYLPHI